MAGGVLVNVRPPSSERYSGACAPFDDVSAVAGAVHRATNSQRRASADHLEPAAVDEQIAGEKIVERCRRRREGACAPLPASRRLRCGTSTINCLDRAGAIAAARRLAPVSCTSVVTSRVHVVLVPSPPTTPPVIPPRDRRKLEASVRSDGKLIPGRPAASSAAEASQPCLPAIACRAALSTRADSPGASGRAAFTTSGTDDRWFGPQAVETASTHAISHR